MQLGTLTWEPVLDHLDLVATPVRSALETWAQDESDAVEQVLVTEIDPELTDTTAMTEAYQLELADSAHCVLVAGRRSGEERLAAAVVRAATLAYVNSRIKRTLGVREASFLRMDRAVEETAIAYGGISPIGLPPAFRLRLDERPTAG